jgi:hypothetical protein
MTTTLEISNGFMRCLCCGKMTQYRTTGPCDVFALGREGCHISLTLGPEQPVCSDECRDRIFVEKQETEYWLRNCQREQIEIDERNAMDDVEPMD